MINQIAQIIENRRKFLGLTQDELSLRAGISVRSLKQIESGTANPTIKQLEKILDILGMKISVVIK